MYLEKINGPEDIKKLSVEQLQPLADEVRTALINRLSKVGGHHGPNLGVVELTVALHYVFDSPKDKIVFDVSHQCYPHKILTGRKRAYTDEEHFSEVTGYTNPLESEHDFFIVGHTSTSVSLALGLAKGRDATGGNENIIAFIGDGSLSGGEALEALDFAGEYDKNLIIIVNDNDQSIAENHGGMYKTLKALRESNGEAENNIFKAFGLDYVYLDDGHNIKALVELLSRVKDTKRPVVVHIHTIKGKGLKYAEENREFWHAGGPFNIEDGSPKYKRENGDNIIYNSIKGLLEKDKTAVILNAATPSGLGFIGAERDKLEKEGRFVDVGIAEENAVAMASGIAKNGGRAVFGTFAPFFQRTYDQMSHDLCLNNSPATMLVLYPGVFGMNSNTHTAMCDIQMFAHIPNFVYLEPTTEEEYTAMFNFATTQTKNPIGLRITADLKSTGEKDETDYSDYNKNKVIKKGEKIAIFALHTLVDIALETAHKYKDKTGKEITVITPRFLTGLDTNLLENLKKDHELIITLEDGLVEGGYGQRISAFYGTDKIKTVNLGITKHFHTDFKPLELLAKCGISADGIIKIIEENL